MRPLVARPLAGSLRAGHQGGAPRAPVGAARVRKAERADMTRMAHHDLLDRVGILADDDPAAYRRVQRAEERLARFYRDGPGWTLLRTRGMVRLIKEPAPAAAGRGLPGLQEPMDYALLAWVLWYGEGLLLASTLGAGGGESQFVLSDLAEALITQTAASPGASPLDLRDHRQRQSLVRALRALEVCQAIRRLQGQLQEWEASGTTNVLYEFTPLAARLPARIDGVDLAPLADGPAHPRAEPRAPATATPLQRAWRALLLGPIFHAVDDPEAFSALVTAAAEVTVVLRTVLGWDLDLRQGFALLVRESMAQYASNALIETERRAIHHPILLLAGLYRARVQAGTLVPDADGVLTLPLAGFESDLWGLWECHKDKWGNVLGTAMTPRERLAEVLQEMRAIGLLRGPDDAGAVHLLPALARVTGHYAAEDGGDVTGPAGGSRRRRRGEGEDDGSSRSGPVALGLF